jgi:ABC-type thiamin/hydroxymethylpyrimidine transport system permease subunit
MSMSDVVPLVIGFVQGFASSSVFVLVLFIGFCVLVGFTKTKATAGNASVVKSLDEAMNHQTVRYFTPTDPRGPADQLRAPELVEAAARK